MGKVSGSDLECSHIKIKIVDIKASLTHLLINTYVLLYSTEFIIANKFMLFLLQSLSEKKMNFV